MKISQKTWQKYISDLRKLSDTAADQFAEYLRTHDVSTSEGIKTAIDYAYALATKYGEGSSEMACQMYDAVAAASGKHIRPAEPAKTPTYGDVAKAVRGTMKTSQNPDYVASAVGRQVKLVGVDTMMQNALRDGAEWAWIPSGDSCPFCLALASNGWQKASKKAIKNGHAEHIHANCDCTYAVRFSDDVDVEGYDPETLREQYENAEGMSSKEKIKYLRRQNYATNAEAIREQKRAAYNKKREYELIKQKVAIGSESIIKWPSSGEKVSRKAFKEIRKYAEEKGIKLAGVRDSDLDLNAVKNAIDNAEKVLTRYDIRDRIKSPFVLDFSHSLAPNDFAESYPGTKHVIYFNKDAFRNLDALEKEYKALADAGFFVNGTDYSAIVYHEMGHIIADIYGIDPVEIAMMILEKESRDDALEEVGRILSEYAGKLGGDEIIAESYSATLSGIDNEFALRFVEECDKIIAQRR